MSTIVIKRATAGDAALIADLSRQTFHDTFAAANTQADMEKFMREQFTREKLMEEVNDPGQVFILAYDGAQVVGYAKMRPGERRMEFNDKASVEIARIYAIKEAIGRGVGQKLMQACIDIARQMNGEIIWLGVWEKNRRAIGFYKKWGFEKFAEHDFILGDDRQRDWLMQKQLR